MQVEGTQLGRTVKRTNSGTLYNAADKNKEPTKAQIARNMGLNTGTSNRSSGSKSSGGGAAAPVTQTPTATAQPTNGGGYSSLADQYEAYLAQIRAAAEDAYNRKMENIANAYNTARGNLDSNRDHTMGQLKSSYDRSNKNINDDAESSLRQSYVNSMLQKRNLGQQLSAMGINGGASESTAASLANRYSNDRNSISNQRDDNLSDLEYTYNTNVSNAYQQYNNAVNSLDLQRMQLENAAADALASNQTAYAANMATIAPNNDAYVNALMQLESLQNNFAYDPTQAAAQLGGFATTQAQTGQNQGTNWGSYLAQQRLGGATDAQIKNATYQQYSAGNITWQQAIGALNGLGISL